MAPQPPWTNSPAIGGSFVYDPKADEIVLKDGRRFARPAQIPRSSLANASWNGPFPFVYTGSPPGPGGNFLLGGGRPQAIPGPANQGNRGPANMTPVGSPGAAHNLNTAMNQVRLRPGPSGGQNHMMQFIPPLRETPVVFQTSTQSQIQRNELVRPPGKTVPGIRIGNENVTGSLFPDYKIRRRDFFKVGRIFLVLWSEPAGGASHVTRWQSGIVLNHLGERVFSKVRRFVVIRDGDSYCNALPINTYGGQGVAKPRVRKSDHCIIWSSRPGTAPLRQGARPGPAPILNTPPLPRNEELPRRGEDGMRPAPIRIDPDSPTEHLDVMSRLNLAGVTTVQHNIRVKSFGMVNQASVRDLIEQFSNVFGSVALPTPLRVQGQPITEEDNDEDEDEDEDEDKDEDEDEDDDDDDDADEDDEESDDEDEATEPAIVPRQGRPAQAPQQPRQYAR
jgi:ribosomal protein L12E/L44/L45/RPP1/RPP2